MNDLTGEWYSNLAECRVRVEDWGGEFVLEFWGDSRTAFSSPRKQVERLAELGYWTRVGEPEEEEEEGEEGEEEDPRRDIERIDTLLDNMHDAMREIRKILEEL